MTDTHGDGDLTAMAGFSGHRQRIRDVVAQHPNTTLDEIYELAYPPDDRDFVPDRGRPDEQRMDAAIRLVRRHFGAPIPSKRWHAHRVAIRQSLHERADSRAISLGGVLEQATTAALVLVLGRVNAILMEGVRPQSRAERSLLTLKVSKYNRWLYNRISDLVMDDLAPGWRQRERTAAISLDAPFAPVVIAAPLDAMIAQDTATVGNPLAVLLAVATPRQREIVITLIDVGGSRTEAARRLGLARSTVSVQIGRLWERWEAARQAPLAS